MKLVTGSLVLLAMFAGAPALAQQAEQPHTPVPLKGEGPQAVPMPAAPELPAFESLVKKGPDGKVVRIEGVMDIIAFGRNKLIDAKTIETIKPAVLNWMADVDQLAIDNLDFVEKLDAEEGKKGLLDEVNVEDKVQLTQMSQMMNQLMSAGPLTAHLETKGLLTREQSALNQQITGDYLQQCMNEIQGEAPPAEMAGNEAGIKTWRVNKLTSFLYALSCKDPIASYRRMQLDAAANIDAVIKAMDFKGDQASQIGSGVAAVKAAKTKAEQRTAVRNLMKTLKFEQRRDFLIRTREVAPVKDPMVNPWS